MKRLAENKYRNTLVCIDNYDNEVPKGFMTNPGINGAFSFSSLTQLIVCMEHLLDYANFPQSFVELRTFLPVEPLKPDKAEISPNHVQGELATFLVRILFRQNASWQGSVTWVEKGTVQSFRSALELFFLFHSALRREQEQGN